MPQGRYSLRSDDGFWVQIDFAGAVWFVTDPAPLMDKTGRRVIERGAASFFSHSEARKVMRANSLFEAEDPRRLESKNPPAAWQIVPDPNP